MKRLPSQEVLHSVFTYNPETGIFVWNKRTPRSNTKCAIHLNDVWNLKNAGQVANKRVKRDGTQILCVFNIQYQAHRLAWMYHYGVDPGEVEIDHLNGMPHDNRISNLRLADRSEQRCNSRKMLTRAGSPTKSLYKGVFATPHGNYSAFVWKNYKTYNLGRFPTIEQTLEARNKKAAELHGAFWKPC